MGLAQQILQGLAGQGFNTNCDPFHAAAAASHSEDMDANYSNGSSIYHGFTTNLRKRFGNHYEFLASYTWSHAIDDSTDLQSTLTPQDSYYPALDRSNSTLRSAPPFRLQRRLPDGRLGNGFVRKLFSDWTFAPIIDIASGPAF